MTEICSGYIYLPTGCPPEDINAHSFQVEVKYRGHYPHRRNGGDPQAWYSIEHMGSSLSRSGKWAFQIQRFQFQQYRFSLDEAREWAAKVVDGVVVNGGTWAQWEARTREDTA